MSDEGKQHAGGLLMIGNRGTGVACAVALALALGACVKPSTPTSAAIYVPTELVAPVAAADPPPEVEEPPAPKGTIVDFIPATCADERLYVDLTRVWSAAGSAAVRTEALTRMAAAVGTSEASRFLGAIRAHGFRPESDLTAFATCTKVGHRSSRLLLLEGEFGDNDVFATIGSALAAVGEKLHVETDGSLPFPIAVIGYSTQYIGLVSPRVIAMASERDAIIAAHARTAPGLRWDVDGKIVAFQMTEHSRVHDVTLTRSDDVLELIYTNARAPGVAADPSQDVTRDPAEFRRDVSQALLEASRVATRVGFPSVPGDLAGVAIDVDRAQSVASVTLHFAVRHFAEGILSISTTTPADLARRLNF